ncbi:MAG: Gfo/Idh/MocA family oxidoreductase [archaeon]|nr:Gfo/Idh/MocA family oxidoreductase [archaeon]
MSSSKTENVEKVAEPLHFGIISTANIGKQFVAGFQASPYCVAAAVGSRGLERAVEWAREQGVERAYGSYEEVLQDARVGAVYVPLPTSMHAEWAVKGAKAGKHVLCEKPLAATFEEAVVMARACDEARVALMDGVMWSHHLKYVAIKRDGHFASLGKVTHCNAHFSWPQLDPANIRLAPSLEPTGCLGDLGWYTIRACLFAFNGELPVSVSAGGQKCPVSGAVVETHALLNYAGGRFATMGCSFATVENQSFEVHGTLGTLCCQDFVWAHSRPDAGNFQIFRGEGRVESHHVAPGPEPFRTLELVNRFASSALKGDTLRQWTLLALKTQAIHDAVLRSSLSDSAPVLLSDYVSQYPDIALPIDII